MRNLKNQFTTATSQLCNSIIRSCGQAVYSNRKGLWVIYRLTHRPAAAAELPYGKPGSYTRLYARLCMFLCTVFQQAFYKFQSVSDMFVHIFHSAHKENENLKKGIIL